MARRKQQPEQQTAVKRRRCPETSISKNLQKAPQVWRDADPVASTADDNRRYSSHSISSTGSVSNLEKEDHIDILIGMKSRSRIRQRKNSVESKPLILITYSPENTNGVYTSEDMLNITGEGYDCSFNLPPKKRRNFRRTLSPDDDDLFQNSSLNSMHHDIDVDQSQKITTLRSESDISVSSRDQQVSNSKLNLDLSGLSGCTERDSFRQVLIDLDASPLQSEVKPTALHTEYSSKSSTLMPSPQIPPRETTSDHLSFTIVHRYGSRNGEHDHKSNTEFHDMHSALNIYSSTRESAMEYVSPVSYSQYSSNRFTGSSQPLSFERSSFCYHSNYYLETFPGADVSFPQSPYLMFQQVMVNKKCDISRITHSEAKVKVFNTENLNEENLMSLCETELLFPLMWGYLDRSFYTGIYEAHRYFIVIWHIQYASKYKCHLDTLFRAVNLMDRCLSNSGLGIHRRLLWLLGAACMCIAAKLEETQQTSIILEMTDIFRDRVCENVCFTKEQLVWMEGLVLRILNYQCSTPTAATFIWYYLKDFLMDKEMKKLSMSIMCLSLTDYQILLYKPSIVAASSVFLACMILRRTPPLVIMLQNWTGSANDKFTHCVQRLDFLFSKASSLSTFKFGF